MVDIICTGCIGNDEETGEVVATSFNGSEKQAIENGWIDSEYGLLCPDCVKNQEGESEVHHLDSDSEDINTLLLTGAAASIINKNKQEQLPEDDKEE